ncbi:methyltransferase [Rhodocyclaceae bacterium SMB388]
MSGLPMLNWEEAGAAHSMRWHSGNDLPAPRRLVPADDTMPADTAYRLACEGTALLWRGDFQNARLLLQAIARRIGRSASGGARAGRSRGRRGSNDVATPPDPVDAFNRYRMAQSQRARILGCVLIPFDDDYVIPLRRAPDVRDACSEAYGRSTGPCVMSLRELQGLIGAHEWRKKGVAIPALDAHIHPHYGVFSPVRGEYVDLVAQAPLPTVRLAFDIGTGTGVLAAVLARRGVQRVVATDQDARALACARDNIGRLGLDACVEVIEADLFPPGRADLVVCNPPWLPARPTSKLEGAIYDPDSRMLRGFLAGLGEHLEPGGEGWLILSDLAEHLGLRTRAELLELFASSGLRVLERVDIRPRHARASDPDDPLHAARSAEITSLWRLGHAGGDR